MLWCGEKGWVWRSQAATTLCPGSCRGNAKPVSGICPPSRYQHRLRGCGVIGDSWKPETPAKIHSALLGSRVKTKVTTASEAGASNGGYIIFIVVGGQAEGSLGVVCLGESWTIRPGTRPPVATVSEGHFRNGGRPSPDSVEPLRATHTTTAPTAGQARAEGQNDQMFSF